MKRNLGGKKLLQNRYQRLEYVIGTRASVIGTRASVIGTPASAIGTPAGVMGGRDQVTHQVSHLVHWAGYEFVPHEFVYLIASIDIWGDPVSWSSKMSNLSGVHSNLCIIKHMRLDFICPVQICHIPALYCRHLK